MRIAVIGAGAAGICVARHVSAIPNWSLVVYEQTGNVGGTWVYNDNTGLDEYELPIHSSMYRNLRTNLPKETMEFTSFKFKQDESYISRLDVLLYLTEFVHYFNLKQYIKFFHYVLKVNPVDESWEITVKNLQTNEIDVSYFDAVVMCNGHFSKPRFPELTGMDKYMKQQMHSHDYRDPERFKEKRVVIVGSGPSGVDITFDLAECAEKIFFSHHSPQLLKHDFPANVVHKPDIKCFTENEVIFQDGTNETVDVIIYCTGYEYSFPFLSKECGITIEDNCMQPLYKHMININFPTMWFIGIPWNSLIFPLFDLQVRCLVNVLLKKVNLPSQEEMFSDLKNDLEERMKNGEKMRYSHKLGERLPNYLKGLANEFNTEHIPDVVLKIYEASRERRNECLKSFREDIYKVIDSDNYYLLTEGKIK